MLFCVRFQFYQLCKYVLEREAQINLVIALFSGMGDKIS